MTAYTQSDVDVIKQSNNDEIYKKQYSASKGAFELVVSTNFRPKNEAVQRPTDEEIEKYERKEKDKRNTAMLLILLVLAGVVGLVIIIFIFQALCGKHSEMEYQKRAADYTKEDVNIR